MDAETTARLQAPVVFATFRKRLLRAGELPRGVLCLLHAEGRFCTGGDLVSFIGSLDQFDLSIILQKIEEYHKTGLLVVKQGDRSVELSFRQGQFLCLGPVKPHISLGERLLSAGIISQEARQAVEGMLGEKCYSETDSALAFLNSGYVDKSSLFRWATIEAVQVLEALFTWQSGDIYFEADAPAPSQRLLIALSITSLLAAIPTTSVAQSDSGKSSEPAPVPQQKQPAIASPETQLSSSALLSGIELPVSRERDTDSISKLRDEAGQSAQTTHTAQTGQSGITRHTPQRVTGQIPPIRVNIAMMQPDMVLTPADLSQHRESNPPVCLTPDQWRLLTRADGQTTLLIAAHELAMSRNQVCQAAGELAELGLVTLSQRNAPPAYAPVDYQYPAYPGMQADVISPNRGEYPVQSYVTPPPMPAYARGQMPIETDSQWGNGGNGATFVLGNGWVVAPPPASSPRGDVEIPQDNRVYAKAG